MEPQGRGSVSPLRTRRRNKVTRPEEDRTLKQWGLNAETRMGGIEPMGEISLLTFLFIGLPEECDGSGLRAKTCGDIAIVNPVAYKEILTGASRKAALRGQPSLDFLLPR